MATISLDQTYTVVLTEKAGNVQIVDADGTVTPYVGQNGVGQSHTVTGKNARYLVASGDAEVDPTPERLRELAELGDQMRRDFASQQQMAADRQMSAARGAGQVLLNEAGSAQEQADRAAEDAGLPTSRDRAPLPGGIVPQNRQGDGDTPEV